MIIGEQVKTARKLLGWSQSALALEASLALGISFLLVLPQAQAAEVLRTAKSGKQTLIRRYFSWNNDCTFKLIKVDITAKPLHGKIEPKFGDHVLTAADVRGGDIGICGGKSIRIVELYYTSEAGFIGKDRFSVRTSAAHLPTIADDYTVDIK
jgi:hypothetical protein